MNSPQHLVETEKDAECPVECDDADFEAHGAEMWQKWDKAWIVFQGLVKRSCNLQPAGRNPWTG
jgi:hypothetical protein